MLEIRLVVSVFLNQYARIKLRLSMYSSKDINMRNIYHAE
jgi:hypothetical protein